MFLVAWDFASVNSKPKLINGQCRNKQIAIAMLELTGKTYKARGMLLK